MVVNSEKAIADLKALGIPEADIRDLFRFRYHLDYDQTKTGRLFMMPERFNMDLEVLAANYPPAYLIGFVNFYHLHINVNSKVLIPRPETEELMTLIEEKQKRTLIHNALDLCTGSGCIALSLKKMFPNAEVYGSDISPYAISVAQENADFNKLEIYLALSDYLTYFVNRKMSFDLIVSNPPYIKDDEILDSSLGYEPQLALFGGKDGLDAYKRIFADLPSVLNVHGVCYLEIEASNAQETLMLAEEMLRGFKAEILKDLEQKDRFLRLVRVS